MADSKERDTVQQYIGDMLALESHIEEALDRQVDDPGEHPKAADAIRRYHELVRSHRDTMRRHLETRGGSESSPVKSAVAALFGVAAGMIDKVRTKAVSKALRDNYTAFNQAAIGYGMLHATAHALRDSATADLAERHLRSYAKAVQEINQLIPDVVVWELRKDGLSVQDATVGHATDELNRIWRETGPQGPAQRAA